MRPPLRPLVLAVATCLAACRSSTDVVSDQYALEAAAQFQSLADDALRSGADPQIIGAYRAIGLALGRNARLSPVTIVVDGSPVDFLATAQQVELPTSVACAGAQTFCLTAPPMRSVIAWDRSNPKRVVQLFGAAALETIAASTPAAPPAPLPGVFSLTYFDGTGGMFVGASATQRISNPVLSDTPCRAERLPSGATMMVQIDRCTQAEFSAAFSGTVAVPPFTIGGNSASGTHTIAMAEQPIHGARVELLVSTNCFPCESYPPQLLPPVSFQGASLQAGLTATATASLVTLELRVTNPQTVPVTLQFSSGQQFDFRVRRLDGSTVWLWSADKGFIAMLTSRTLAAGETATYAATWAPTEHGSFIVEGRLTSTSHPVGSAAPLSVP